MAESDIIGGDSVLTENNGSRDGQDGQDGVPLVFLKETSIFGQRQPAPHEWLKHEELYTSIGNIIAASHITGLQRVNGFWRIYLDNLTDKVTLMAQGVPLRGKSVPVLRTNPNRLDSEITTKVRIKNIPLSVDDDSIIRVLTLKGIDVISNFREKLRINGKLTNCATGDRVLIVKSSTLKEPLPNFMIFGRTKGRVLHYGQPKKDKPASTTEQTCSKCLQEGHRFAQCENDWTCKTCLQSGHKAADCIQDSCRTEGMGSAYSGESEADVSEADDNSQDDDAADLVQPRETPARHPLRPEDTPESTCATVNSPTRKQRKPKRADKKDKQQQKLTEFIVQSSASGSTPGSDRRAGQVRSPPTPAEQLRDNSKKSKS